VRRGSAGAVYDRAYLVQLRKSARSQTAPTVALVILLFALPALAQQTRTEQIEQEKLAKATALQPEQREKGDEIIAKLEHIFAPEPPAVTPTAGDFRQGAGFPFGVAFTMPAMKRGLWRTEAAWSVNNFKQGHTRLEFPPLAAGHLTVVTDAKWNDAPDLNFFGLNNESSRQNETRYGLRWVEAGLDLNAQVHKWLRFGAGAGYLGTRSSKEEGPAFSTGTLPRFGGRLDWVDVRASAAIDTRESPGYTRGGGLYAATFHRYQDPDGQRSFNLTDLDARQFIPLLHENWIVALQGRAQMTDVAPSQSIPYFMLPYIGGRDTLRGFDAYRFTDRNSLLLRGELRWTAAPMVDMAVFFGEGKVAPRVQDLDLHHLHRDVGFGARIHGPSFTALRLEVAHSVEGWHFTAAHSISF
jgi:surface antigen Omp85-like protein